MPLEIDMLSVRDADAIVIRTTKGTDEHVILLDAGNKSDAETVVSHINKYTWRKDTVDILISTHPHSDHVGGVFEVLCNLKVCAALIHDPSLYQQNSRMRMAIAAYETDDDAKKSIEQLNDVISQIDSKSIPREQPFAGKQIPLLGGASLMIVGPTESLYSSLAPTMKSKSAVRTADEDCATLEEDDDKSPFNNSSVVSLLKYAGQRFLFTADAGPIGLNCAIESACDDLKNIDWLQIPHHGSKRNINCEYIQYFSPTWALVSAIGDDDHPHPAVVRSFKDAGTQVYGTNKSGSLCHRFNVPMRDGWRTATELDENGK